MKALSQASLLPSLVTALLISASGLHAATIYVLNSGTVGKYSTTGATINDSLITGLTYAGGIRVADGSLYISNSITTVGRYTTGGAVVNAGLINVSGPSKIAISGTNLFVSSSFGAAVSAFTNGGATLNQSLITGLNSAQALAVSGTSLLVGDFITQLIGEYAFDGTLINGSFINGNGVGFRSLAVSDGYIYTVSDGVVGKYNLDGSVVNASLITGLFGPGSHGPYDLAVWGGHIYVPIYDDGVVRDYTTDGVLVNAALITGLGGPTYLAFEPDAAPEPGRAMLLALGGTFTLLRRRRLTSPRLITSMSPDL